MGPMGYGEGRAALQQDEFLQRALNIEHVAGPP
jgi:hypothetical protein